MRLPYLRLLYIALFVACSVSLAACEGPVGPMGPQGERGEKGERGERGLRGVRGEKGDQGERGERGERGPIGTDAFKLFTFFRTDFSDRDQTRSWNKRGSGGGRVQGGRLILRGSDDGFLTTLTSSADFSGPLYVEVTTQWLSGVKNYGYGIQFYTGVEYVSSGFLGGYYVAGRDYYGFIITADGWYSIDRWDNGDPLSLVDWTYSSVINQEGTNTLSVLIQEGRIEASINEIFVAEVFDDAYTEGRVGVLISGDQEVAFDDLTVGTIRSLSD